VGIEFPFPQRDVHIKDGVLKVETAAEKRTQDRLEG
jgi:small-conductance mechanosensitive channel